MKHSPAIIRQTQQQAEALRLGAAVMTCRQTDELRTLEAYRLDVLFQIAAGKVVTRNLGAIGRCLAIMERRAGSSRVRPALGTGAPPRPAADPRGSAAPGLGARRTLRTGRPSART